jgi:hypothetical protein
MRSLILLCFCAVGALAQAQVVYSTGFEEPTFTTGTTITGKDGWINHFSGPNDAGLAQTGIVFAGSQSAQYTTQVGASASAFGGFASGTVRIFNVSTAPIYELSWAMRLGQQGRRSQFWGMGEFLSPTQSRALLGLNDTGRVVYGANPTALTVVGSPLAFDTWHTFKMSFNVVTGQVSTTVNGINQGTFAAAPGGPTLFSAASMFRYGTLNDRNDTTYFDSVQLQGVPEPASMIALAAGAGALIARRRRKA